MPSYVKPDRATAIAMKLLLYRMLCTKSAQTIQPR